MSEQEYEIVTRELCEDCSKSYGGGCPIWPPIQITYDCVEFEPLKDKSPR
jgi:hypothetical protein